MAKTPEPTPAIGRPRRFDDETERQMLVDAADRVMSASGDTSISLGAVLAEADLSTRAFYRHFDSKEELIEAVMLRESAAVGRSLAAVVAKAPDPVAALNAWLDRLLDVFYQPRRAERAALLTSAAHRLSRPSAQMIMEMRRISCAPLVGALRSGHDAGLLHSPTPEADAHSIYELVNVARAQQRDVDASGRAAAIAHVVRFAWPALGLANSPTSTP